MTHGTKQFDILYINNTIRYMAMFIRLSLEDVQSFKRKLFYYKITIRNVFSNQSQYCYYDF